MVEIYGAQGPLQIVFPSTRPKYDPTQGELFGRIMS